MGCRATLLLLLLLTPPPPAENTNLNSLKSNASSAFSTFQKQPKENIGFITLIRGGVMVVMLLWLK